MWTCDENRAQLCSTTSLLDLAGPAILTQVFMGTDPKGGMEEGGVKGGGRISHWKVSQVSPLLTPCHQERSSGQGGSLAPWGGNRLSLQEPPLRWGLAHLPRTGGNALCNHGVPYLLGWWAQGGFGMLAMLPWQQEAAVWGAKTPVPPSLLPSGRLFWVSHAWSPLQKANEQAPQGWGNTEQPAHSLHQGVEFLVTNSCPLTARALW